DAILAEAKRRMPNSFDVLKASAAGKKDVFAFKLEELEKKKKKVEEEAQKMQSLFQKACEKQKTPKSSPKKIPASPFSTGKKSEKDEDASNSPIFKRKRQRKIMLDNGSEGEEETTSPKEKEVKKRRGEEMKEKEKEKEKKEKEKKEKEKKRVIIESDDVLFDTSDDSPVKKEIKEEEEMEVDEVEEKSSKKKGKKEEKKEKKKEKTLEESGAFRRSPRKHQAASSSSSSGPTKKFVQKDVTFTNDDGEMVTRREMVEVEISEEEIKKEKEEERRPLEAMKKVNVPSASTKVRGAAATKKAPVGQSKISSFFTKK
ncbi:hypothetical protein PENTCL1PPCAC_27434, partial [Pristionchus entomophagus]